MQVSTQGEANNKQNLGCGCGIVAILVSSNSNNPSLNRAAKLYSVLRKNVNNRKSETSQTFRVFTKNLLTLNKNEKVWVTTNDTYNFRQCFMLLMTNFGNIVSRHRTHLTVLQNPRSKIVNTHQQ